ncbi:hypothetical protein CHUAL_003779 [Chamberlinius hualienensis]
MTDDINLFEFKRILCCSTDSQPVGYDEEIVAGSQVIGASNEPNVKVECFAWTSNRLNRFNCLALYLSNYTVVLYRPNEKIDGKPSAHQIPWYSSASKQVVAMTFSPDGVWLLLAVKDSSVYIVPSLKLMDPRSDVDAIWPLDDITEIKIHGRRASPTAIVWWETNDGRSIAIVSNELGEIAFINLVISREVGGTYITVGIQNIELVEDEAKLTVYLLITGINQVQWQLILEKEEDYCWPLESYVSTSTKEEKSGLFGLQSSIILCLASCEGRRPVVDTRNEDTRPKRLDCFAGHTHLKLQEFMDTFYIAGYFKQTSILSIHSTDLNIVPQFVYKVPADTVKFLVQEKIIFVVSPMVSDAENKSAVQIILTDLATTSIDDHKDFNSLSRLQYFYLDSNDELLSIISYGPLSCIIVTSKNIYQIYNRFGIEEIITDVILHERDAGKAERLGKLLGVNLSSVYEKVADQKLAEGLITAAIRFYQTAKCPHLQCVAKFATQGHVYEVLSYIRILFANKNNTFPVAELVQLSNMALMCHIHQCLEYRMEPNTHINCFRVFLRENQYYDEKAAVFLLYKYELFDLLMELAEVRGLFSNALELLLPKDESISLWSDRKVSTKPLWMDDETATILSECGYQELTALEENDLYVESLLHTNLTECFDLREDLLWRHVKLARRLVPVWIERIDRIKNLLLIYNPCGLHFLNSLLKDRLSTTYDQLYRQLPSPRVYDRVSNVISEVSSYFLELILLLIKRKNVSLSYESKLVMPCLPMAEEETENELVQSTYVVRRNIISCGCAHSAVVVNGLVHTWGRNQEGCLGRGSTRYEWLPVEPLSLLQQTFIRVISVSCGATHTVAITDVGVYAWGSNRYGQLGLGPSTPTGMCCQRVEPTPVFSLSGVLLTDVTCGQYHTLGLAVDGVVYSWGWGVHGQLGHGNALDCCLPTQISALKSYIVTHISAGYAHSLFQTSAGDVYACGCGAFGQLGNGIACKRSTPIKVPIDEKVASSSSGYFHNVAVSVSGRLITWGCNPQTLRLRAQASRRARLVGHAVAGGGTAMTSEPPANCIADIALTPGVFNPIEVDGEAISSPISKIACGSSHTIVLTTDGDVFSWGRNLDGQLGVENRKERLSPEALVVLNDRKFVQVSCGMDFTLLVDSCGKIWGFGLDSYGQVCGAMERGKWSQPDVNLSPSKIITVRTNRRVVQIKSPTRSSVYRPQQLNGISQIYDTRDCYENVKLVISSCFKIFNMIENNEILNDSLHYAIELLHSGYSADDIKSTCIESKAWQAAAKVAFLMKDYSQSFNWHVQCIASSDNLSPSEMCSILIDLLDKFVCITKTEMKHQIEILRSTVSFWSSFSLCMESLESYLRKNVDVLLVPISYIIFGISNDAEENCLLSTQFCFDVVQSVMEKISEGDPDPKFISLMNDIEMCPGTTEVDGSESSSKADESIKCKSYIDISSDELERLRQILPAANVGESGKSNTILKVFTCGHLYTLSSFHRVALPLLKDSISYFAPSNAKQLADNYANLDFQPMACPKCLVVGFQKDRVELAQITS